MPMPFPGYADVAELGRGRLTTVYRAREEQTGRMVALKVFADPDGFDVVARSVDVVPPHPHLVARLAAFRAPDGRPVLVEELCSGPLSVPLPLVDAVTTAAKIADALDTAHRHGLVHAAVRPGKILLTGSGEPALTGLGFAALRTIGGAGLGYAAPEQVAGRPVSPATDGYGLAATLYALVTRRAPFRPRPGDSSATLVLRVLHDPAPRLADVPERLADVVDRGLAKDPHRRPAMTAFAAALRAALATPSTVARVEQPADRPTWVFDAAAAPVSAAPADDLSLDPASLRRRVRIRAGAAVLIADEDGLTLRTGLREQARLPWTDVRGFETQLAGPTGQLVAVTKAGPVELRATRRPIGELGYLHALLDAYLRRAR